MADAPDGWGPEAMRAALLWQIEAGADEAVCEEPIDRTVAAPPPEARPVDAALAAPVRLSAAPELQNAAPAAALAAQAQTLAALREALDSFDHPLKTRARRLVFADGNPAARVMIVGEAPGADEDRQGLPFVGRSGRLLDQMMQAIGLNRAAEDPAQAIYLTNIVVWRPVDNRNPAVSDVAAFAPFALRHIELIQPEILIPVGGVAAKALLGVETGIMRLRGRWDAVRAGGREIPCLPMLHPAYLLRNPLDKAKAWRDLLSLRGRLNEQEIK